MGDSIATPRSQHVNSRLIMNNKLINRIYQESSFVYSEVENAAEMDSISENKELHILVTHYIFALIYLLLLVGLMFIVCYLTYYYQARRRRRSRARLYNRMEDDKPPTYQALFFSETPPDYGTLGSPPDYGSIVKNTNSGFRII